MEKQLSAGCARERAGLPGDSDYSEQPSPPEIVARLRLLQRGEHLFRLGVPKNSLYLVRHGAFKTSTLRPDGIEQVMSFHLPGELIGLDTLGPGMHRCEAVALIDGSVCEALSTRLDNGCAEPSSQQQELLRMIGQSMRCDRDHMEMLVRKLPNERIALFLHCFFERRSHYGELAVGFRLPMSREDIANFLGLALETVSRTFTQLRDGGVIRLEGRQIEGLNMAEIARLATRGAAQETLAEASVA